MIGRQRWPNAWTRTTKWQWSNGAFYKVDTSKIQVQLLVKYNDKLAVIRPINIYKNHMKGDTIASFPLFGLKEKLQPNELIPLAKVK